MKCAPASEKACLEAFAREREKILKYHATGALKVLWGGGGLTNGIDLERGILERIILQQV